jgi:hypothetical protein
VEGCPALASSPSETCHMEVWEKAWENFREVQWDNVNCTAKVTTPTKTTLEQVFIQKIAF